jgi:hypothetical protein
MPAIWQLMLATAGMIEAAPADVYVDVAYRTNGAWVTFPNSGGSGLYCVGSNAFNSIQAGVDHVASAGTVHVAAGLYVENVPVRKSLTMLGPNAGRPGDGPRFAEAMLVPAYNDPENSGIIIVEASHVVIDGFLLDGHNPIPPLNFGTGYNANGVQVYAAAGVQNGYYPDLLLDVDHITIQNNIIRNISYDGVYLDRYPFFGTASGWNYVQRNKFENMWEGLLTYAVDAVIANNTITNVTHGLSVHGVCVPAPDGFVPRICSNILTIAQWWPTEIDVVHAPGIWVNFRRGNASLLSVQTNVIHTPKPAPAGKTIRGLEILTVDEQGKVELVGNIVNGYGNCHEGIYASACWSNDAVTVRGGALNNIKNTAIILRTTDPEWPPEWPSAVDTFLTVRGVSMQMTPGSTGIHVWQPQSTPTNRAHATVTGNTTIQGASVGIKIQGSKAGATIKGNPDLLRTTGVGIDADGGRGLLEANDLTGCFTAGIIARNNAVIDAGDCTGTNSTGLGTGGNAGGSSVGLNDLSGYGFDNQAPWAIISLAPATVVARSNTFGGSPSENIALAISGEVEFSQWGGMHVQAPPATTVERLSELPAPSGTFADFLRAGGKASSSSGSVSAKDFVRANEAGGYTVTRVYALKDACGDSATCNQIITVRETACTLSVLLTNAGNATVVVDGIRGSRGALLTTTDFLHWVNLGTNTVPFTWRDITPATTRCRFYRVLITP